MSERELTLDELAKRVLVLSDLQAQQATSIRELAQLMRVHIERFEPPDSQPQAEAHHLTATETEILHKALLASTTIVARGYSDDEIAAIRTEAHAAGYAEAIRDAAQWHDEQAGAWLDQAKTARRLSHAGDEADQQEWYRRAHETYAGHRIIHRQSADRIRALAPSAATEGGEK